MPAHGRNKQERVAVRVLGGRQPTLRDIKGVPGCGQRPLSRAKVANDQGKKARHASMD
jgi:hypothetical protein